MVPTRPTNISITSTKRADGGNCAVMPVDRPTVEKAEIALWAPGQVSLTPDQATFQIGPRGLPQS